jgi:hypothetical protein
MLSQVLKLNATLLAQCHDKISEFQMLSTYKCHLTSFGDLLGIFGGLQIFELKLAMG